MKIVCSKCKLEKDQKEFFKDKQKRTGYRPDCKTCNTKKSIEWSKKNKQKRHGYEIKNRYGIDKEEYLDLLKKQNEKCGICKKHKSNFKKRLSVDHCHQTNKVRGLLCTNCNQGIGQLQDSISILENAIKYLEDSNV